MTGGDLAAVVVTVCVLVALAALVAVLAQAFALIREFRRKLEDFDARVEPALRQLAETAEMAQVEIGRLRDLMNLAQKVAGLAESAGAATARVAAAPVDKVRSALSALRGSQSGDNTSGAAKRDAPTGRGSAARSETSGDRRETER
ncbi:hypothetical protein [Candidatus Poriferisodalis sp.]|uniref:hypothetical protein n=1 Tax=Candidatus Poriferisodalis sp. TaxID=3101277 RepID=UPI003B026428